jgi:CRP/FNR family transcriptional regulator
LKDVTSTASINDIPSFHDLSDAGRSLLGRGLRYAQYSRTTPLLQKGQRVSGAYVVVRGQLRVFTSTPDGHEATLYLIHTGETCVLALNCIFSDLLYPAWVEASPATRVAIIPGAVFRTLFDSEPAIRNMTVQAFSGLVFRLMTALEEVHSSTLEQRLANFLLLHASADGTLTTTQQAIASHLGTTREVIARALGHLRLGGHIRTGRNTIIITDPARLADTLRPAVSQPGVRQRASPEARTRAAPSTRRRGQG